ncbi:Pepsin-like aspartic protease a1 [Globisporangium polare]
MSAGNSSSSSSSGTGSAGVLTSGTKIPLSRQRVVDFKSGNNNGITANTNSTNDRKLTQEATSSGSNDVALTNYNSVIYFAEISIDGTTFEVLVDTGSSDLWISCAYLSNTSCSTTCPAKATVISYGSGDVCITGAYASVKIGDVAVSKYVVSIAQGVNVMPSSSTNLLPGGSQGLLGLGYQALAAIPSPGGQFIDYLTSFSIYLTDDAYSEGSFLLLNAVDDALIAKNKLTGYTIPLKEEAHWTIAMTAFQVGNDTAVIPCSSSSSSSSSSGCRSIVDTGTSLLTMPNTLFNSFASTYLVPKGCFIPTSSGSSSSSSSSSSYYVCPKSAKLPRLAFTFGTYTFYLEGADYMLPVSQTSYNIVELQPTGSGSLGNTWIIGDTFLKQFYSSYATNKSVTFYCNPGTSCSEGTVTATDYPSSGSLSPSSSGDNGSANTSTGSSKLTSTETILVIAVAVLGLAVLLVILVQIRRCLRARRARRQHADNVLNGPIVNGAYYPGNLTPTSRV